MDYFLLFGLIGFGGIILGFLGYKFTTERVIKDQEREISELTKEIERYKSALRGAKYVEKIVYHKEPLESGQLKATIKVVNKQEDLFKEF